MAVSSLAAKLREVRTGSRSAAELRLETECGTPDGYRSAVLFGTGVGIWQRDRAFRLASDEVRRLLRGLDRFFALAEVYGAGEEADRPLTIICSVTLSIDGETRRVAQMDRGEQSKELRDLANEILDLGRGPGEVGTSVSSLDEGLRGVARGSLPSEILTVSLHHPALPDGTSGWLLRLSGRRLTSQDLRREGGYGDVMAVMLTDPETTAVAALLVEIAVWDVPGNLSVPGYADLRVAVLGESKEIQARTFAGRSAAPDDSARFERIERALEALHRRAQKEGRREPS